MYICTFISYETFAKKLAFCKLEHELKNTKNYNIFVESGKAEKTFNSDCVFDK